MSIAQKQELIKIAEQSIANNAVMLEMLTKMDTKGRDRYLPKVQASIERSERIIKTLKAS